MVNSYEKSQIILHWAVVVLVVLQYVFHDAIGAALRAAMRGQMITFDPFVAIHVFGGLAILLLMTARVALRLIHGAPPPPEPAHRLRDALAKLVHIGLYALLFLMPISGAVAWFGMIENAAEAHEIMRAVLLLLILLHIGGALVHQLILKDNLMQRMSMKAR